MEGRDGALASQAEAEKIRNKELADKKYALGRQIAYLKANSQDAQTKALVDQYGRVREMMCASNFTDEVIGPLCDYITLKDQRWYKPVSIVLKRSLSAFIVFNRRDRQLLGDIFKRAGVNFPMSLLSSKQVVGGLKTVESSMLDVLELRRDVVLNQLVMFHNVEQIMLVERRESAYQIIKNGSADRRARAIECAYTLDGDKIKLTNGSLSDYKARDAGRHWFEDSSTRVKALEQALGKTAASSVAQGALDENGALLREAGMRKKELEAAKRELEARIFSIVDLKENSTAGYEKKLAALSRNTAALQAKMRECSEQTAAELSRKRLLEERNAEGREACIRERKECEKEIERMGMSMAMLDSATTELVVEKRNLIGSVERKVEEILKMERRLNAGRRASPADCLDVVESENSKNKATGKDPGTLGGKPVLGSNSLVGDASDGCPASARAGLGCGTQDTAPGCDGLEEGGQSMDLPDTYRGYGALLPENVRRHLAGRRTAADVAREKRAIRDCIRQARRLRSREDIRKEIAVLVRERNMHQRIRERFERMTGETIAACEKRLAKRDEIKNKKTVEAASLFREYTSRGGYEGQLLFDHDNRKLDLVMKVHRSAIAGSKATLSGGERSFAGVCFLLSLWRSFRCPVKVLDEFDVFMDVINRRVAIRTLFEFFKENEMQVVLITPLSTDELVDDECEIRVLSKEQG